MKEVSYYYRVVSAESVRTVKGPDLNEEYASSKIHFFYCETKNWHLLRTVSILRSTYGAFDDFKRTEFHSGNAATGKSSSDR